MKFWSALFSTRESESVYTPVKAAGVLKDEPGWYYEESQNFSRSQSTVRIDQQRPGNWETYRSSCGIVGLNKPERKDDVARFFAGSYRWLQLERELDGSSGAGSVKVTGAYVNKNGKKHAVHQGYLQRELSEELEGEDLSNLWGRIRFIRFPSRNRNSSYLIRFDLMQEDALARIA